MKRCPQCLFLYPDSDEKCDFDQTALETVDDSALEPATPPKKSRTLPIVAVAVALIVGVLVVALYFGLSSRSQEASAAPESSTDVQPVTTPAPVTPSPSAPAPSPSPSASPSASPKASPMISTAHTRSTGDPVSTSGPGIGTRQGGKPVIMLASGGKIEADEVWRTKDGVWYRRNGIVTLLKRGQVKNISTR